MELEYVDLSTACKNIFPVINLITKLSRKVGISKPGATNIHVWMHEESVGALTLGRLEPRRITPCLKHYTLK